MIALDSYQVSHIGFTQTVVESIVVDFKEIDCDCPGLSCTSRSYTVPESTSVVLKERECVSASSGVPLLYSKVRVYAPFAPATGVMSIGL